MNKNGIFFNIEELCVQRVTMSRYVQEMLEYWVVETQNGLDEMRDSMIFNKADFKLFSTFVHDKKALKNSPQYKRWMESEEKFVERAMRVYEQKLSLKKKFPEYADILK